MSAELPALERLLSDAAERHYGRRRFPLRTPRLRVVAGLAGAAAAVALAIAILPMSSDERAAQPRSDPAAQLAGLYSVFAGTHTATPLETAALDDQGDILDLSKPVTTRLLRRFPHGGVVALVGTTKRSEPAVCVSVQRKTTGGGGCSLVADLLEDDAPGFTFGSIGRYTNEISALVSDKITSVRIELKSGATRELPLDNNLAYASADEPICRVSWTTADGQTGHRRGPTRLEEATPDDPKPPTCD
jgi:hypothetical protein